MPSSQQVYLLRHGAEMQRKDALERLMPGYLANAKCHFGLSSQALEGSSYQYRDGLFSLKSSVIDGAFTEAVPGWSDMAALDGIDDVIGLSSLGLNPGTADFSFALIVKQDPNWTWDSGSHTIIGNRGHGEVTSWGLRTGGTNGTLRLSCANILGASSTGHDIRTAPALVHGTFDRDGNMILYVNGAAKVTTAIGAGSANSMSQTTFTLGRRGVATFDYFGGWIRDLIVWHSKLVSANDILQHAKLLGVA